MESNQPVVELLLLVLENCIRVNQGDPEDGAQVGGVGGGDGEGQFEVFGWRGCWKDGGEAWVAVVEEKQVARQVIWPKEVARSKASISPVGKSLVEGEALFLPIQDLHQDVGKVLQRPG